MFETRADAEDAIRRLRAAGFGNDAIGIAMRNRTEAGELIESTGVHDMSGEGAAAGALSGAGVGALIGLALVGSHLLLPGIGPVVVGGPLAAGLTGAGIGAASGGLIGALIGAGIPEEDARDYSRRIEAGHILVSVQVPDADADRAREILVEEGATVA